MNFPCRSGGWKGQMQMQTRASQCEGWYENKEWVWESGVVQISMAGSSGSNNGGSCSTCSSNSRGGILHGLPFLQSYIYIYISNIYSHVILYLRYFNKKKPQVPWVLQVLFNTAWIKGQYWCIPRMGMVSAGSGTVRETRPLLYPWRTLDSLHVPPFHGQPFWGTVIL